MKGGNLSQRLNQIGGKESQKMRFLLIVILEFIIVDKGTNIKQLHGNELLIVVAKVADHKDELLQALPLLLKIP